MITILQKWYAFPDGEVEGGIDKNLIKKTFEKFSPI